MFGLDSALAGQKIIGPLDVCVERARIGECIAHSERVTRSGRPRTGAGLDGAGPESDSQRERGSPPNPLHLLQPAIWICLMVSAIAIISGVLPASCAALPRSPRALWARLKVSAVVAPTVRSP